MRLSRPPAAFVALAAVAGCGSEKDVVLTVSGRAPGAVALFVRVVDDRGARDQVYSAGDAANAVKLPATVHLRLNSARVGAVVWLADAAGNLVAQGRTERCAEMAAGGKYEVALSPLPDGWTPATADRCRCSPSNPLGPMCPGPSGTDAGTGASDAEAVPDGAAGSSADAAADTSVAVAPDAAADAALTDAPADARDGGADRSTDLRTDLATSAGVPVPLLLFGFENAGSDWISTDTSLMRDTVRTEGAASLAFTVGATGVSTLRSRSFDTGAFSATGSRLSVDAFVNEPQTSDANTEMWVDCQSAGVFGVYMGYQGLTELKAPGWTPLTFQIPPQVMSAFSGKVPDCQVSFRLAGKGLFRYDRLTFAP